MRPPARNTGRRLHGRCSWRPFSVRVRPNSEKVARRTRSREAVAREIVAEGGDGLRALAQADGMVHGLVGVIVEFARGSSALLGEKNTDTEIGANQLRYGPQGQGEGEIGDRAAGI